MKVLHRVLKIWHTLTSLASNALEAALALARDAASQDSCRLGPKKRNCDGWIYCIVQEGLRGPEDSGADQTRVIMEFVEREGKLV